VIASKLVFNCLVALGSVYSWWRGVCRRNAYGTYEPVHQED